MTHIKNNRQDKLIKVENAWATTMNPLRGLTQSGIKNLVEQLKYGNDIRLQVAFKEIEQNTPIFGICINKRLAGITSRNWDIVPMDESEDAKNQAEVVKQMFKKSDTRNLDGLTEALRHLGMASFRGRAVVKPFINDNNELYFRTIENWNTLEWNNHIYWNPTANQMINFTSEIKNTLQELSEDEIIWVKEERPIDIPGLQIYLRQLVGEEGWARATEKYGVAQVIITAPDGTPDTDLDKWNSRALTIFEGGSGVLPPQAKVDQLTDARGQDPFTEFVKHQQEMIVLLACGEKLTTLGGSTGLGSDLASIQSQEFQNLINYDCKRISNSMTRCAVAKCVKKVYGDNAEVKCRFTFVEQDDTTPEKYIELAERCKNLGIAIDISKLKALTGLQFISDEQKDVWTPTNDEVEGK